jgi:hypothetical protein
MIVKGANESERNFYRILKAITAATGDTIFYNSTTEPYADIESVYSSYAPTVLIGGINAGNGNHAEGYLTSTWGIAAHSQGSLTNAWNHYTHAGGSNSNATGTAAFVQGADCEATGNYSTVFGSVNVGSGDYSFTDGVFSSASGAYSSAFGAYDTAGGIASSAIGWYAKAPRKGQHAISVDKWDVAGDNQKSEWIAPLKLCNGAGWHNITILDSIETTKVYFGTTYILGTQESGAGGVVGEAFAYKFEWVLDGATYTIIGAAIRTLIGRNVSDGGDGLTTGVRLAWGGRYGATDDIYVRMDGDADRNYRVAVWTQFIELGF